MMDNSPQLAIFYEAGCGKTMCVLDFLYRAFKNREISNALVICPASVVSSWQSSIEKMKQFKGYTSYGVDQMKKLVTIRSFQKTYERKARQIRHRNGTVETIKGKARIREDIFHPWDVIVIDESHGLGNHSATQTKIALSLSEFADRRYILTGTPVSGGGGREDFKKLYGQMKFLNPDIWSNWDAFCAELVTKFDFFNNPCEYKVEECRALMKNYGIVARLNDCYDMPAAIDISVSIQPAPQAMKAYSDIRSGNIEEYNIELPTGGAYFVKLLELMSGFLIDKDAVTKQYPCNKPAALAEILEGTDDKVVIFCNYRHSVDTVAKLCEKHGKTTVYDGRSKADAWREFQYGDSEYLVCQYQSGGVGIDLFASHTTVFYEPSLSSLLTEQAKARTRRKGQESRCLYYWLTTPGTVESRVIDTVKSGVDVTREMLEKWAKEGM